MFSRKMITFCLLAFLFALASCSLEENSSRPSSANGLLTSPGVNSLEKCTLPGLINNFEVVFNGRTLVNGNTRFSWTVKGAGIEPDLSQFMIQLPDCAPEPLSYCPADSVRIITDRRTGIFGVEWRLDIDPDDYIGQECSITFPGDVPLGEVYASVTNLKDVGVGVVPGPCQGFEISGRVFIDPDENGSRDQNEDSGIPNVVVEIVNSIGTVLNVTTDQNGNYSFRKLDGDFTLNLSLEGYTEFFNGSLAESFNPTTALSVNVTVPPESLNNDFGFSPNTEEIIADLDSGELVSEGQTLKFWRKEFRAFACKHERRNQGRGHPNGHGRHNYSEEELLGFLEEIQGLFRDDVFSFTPGEEIEEAYEILRARGRRNQPLKRLLAEMLATELNQVSGQGLVDKMDLQLVLISWGETIAADFLVADCLEKGANLEKGRVPVTMVDEAAEVFSKLNTGGGGIVDE